MGRANERMQQYYKMEFKYFKDFENWIWPKFVINAFSVK